MSDPIKFERPKNVAKEVNEMLRQHVQGVPAMTDTSEGARYPANPNCTDPMSETDAYNAGRAAFKAGKRPQDCPFPLPSKRNGADSLGYLHGAFWLDGFQHERDGVVS